MVEMRPGISGRPAYLLYKWVWSGLDLLYPPRCGGCGKTGHRWCPTCEEGVERLNSSICFRCGKNLSRSGTCQRCRSDPPEFLALRSWGIYRGELRKAIHRLKYSGDVALGDVLAVPMISMLARLDWPVDYITPVPMVNTQKVERGYNQAALLAFPIALSEKIPYEPGALAKIRMVQSQVGLSLVERYNNVEKVYKANRKFVEGKIALVIDDVVTSGATMNACAEALMDAGAAAVYGLTLSRASINTFRR